MTVAEPSAPRSRPARATRSASPVILGHTARAAVRSAVLWGYVFGVAVVSSAWSYSSLYKTPAQRHQLAVTFGHNQATVALFGPAPDLQTVGGFTVFKVSMTLMIVGGVWGLLTGSRLMRGEEDAGRWDLLLLGPSTRRGATAQALGGLAAATAVLWLLTALITAVGGLSARVGVGFGAALFLALALVSSAAMFLAVAAVTSQLAPTRRQAAGYGALVLGLSYALRMIGDAGVGLHALTWLSPLGWVEQLAPLTGDHPAPLALIAGFTALAAGTAVYLAGQRDVGAGLLPDRPPRRARLRLLASPFGLGVRLIRGTAAAWITALVVFGLLFGLVAKGAGETLSGSSVQQVFDKLGATGGGLDAYLGVVFLMVAVLLGFAAAGQVTAARTEEAEGRLDHLLVRPVSRVGWLGGRLVLTVALVGVGGVTAGFCVWLGAQTQHATAGIGTLVAAGANAATPAVFLLGVGALLIGCWPRVATPGVYVVLGWSLLVTLIGGIGATSHWVLDTSVFHHVTSAPAVPPDWGADAVTAAIGVAAAVVGAFAFRRRDLQTG